MKNLTIMEGKIRNEDKFIPFAIVWNIDLDVYRLHAESSTTACPEDAFPTAMDALNYLYENFASWSD